MNCGTFMEIAETLVTGVRSAQKGSSLLLKLQPFSKQENIMNLLHPWGRTLREDFIILQLVKMLIAIL
jgi:hypothetical protein